MLVTVFEDAVVFGKTLFPGTVMGLFTAANTGAGFGCAKTETREILVLDTVSINNLCI